MSLLALVKLIVLINSAVICYNYVVSVVDGGMCIDHWWNDTHCNTKLLGYKVI